MQVKGRYPQVYLEYYAEHDREYFWECEPQHAVKGEMLVGEQPQVAYRISGTAWRVSEETDHVEWKMQGLKSNHQFFGVWAEVQEKGSQQAL